MWLEDKYASITEAGAGMDLGGIIRNIYRYDPQSLASEGR